LQAGHKLQVTKNGKKLDFR